MNTLVPVSKKELVETIFNAAIPFQEKMSAWAFRHIILRNAKQQIQSASFSAFYNKAKKKAIADGLMKDFGRAVESKLGSRIPADPAVEAEMEATIAQALRIVKGEETIELNFKWLVVNKATNVTVTGAESKNKAYKLKDGNPDLVVRKAA